MAVTLYGCTVVGIVIGVFLMTGTNAQQVDTETICSPSSEKNNGSVSMCVHQNMMTFLQAKLAVQDAKLAALEAKVAAQDARAVSCDKWEQGLTARDRALDLKIDTVRREVNERKSNISFLAVHTVAQSVALNTVVKFTTIRHNTAPQHYGFDTRINHYRCPVTGVYSFTFGAVTASDCSNFYLSIKRDQTTLTTAHNRGGLNSHSDCVYTITASAVSPCNKGDYVYVQSVTSNTGRLYSTDKGLTYFTGFKIY